MGADHQPKELSQEELELRKTRVISDLTSIAPSLGTGDSFWGRLFLASFGHSKDSRDLFLNDAGDYELERAEEVTFQQQAVAEIQTIVAGIVPTELQPAGFHEEPIPERITDDYRHLIQSDPDRGEAGNELLGKIDRATDHYYRFLEVNHPELAPHDDDNRSFRVYGWMAMDSSYFIKRLFLLDMIDKQQQDSIGHTPWYQRRYDLPPLPKIES